MTYESSASKARYAGNGVSTAFPTPFTFVDNGHVKCVFSVANASGGYDESTLVEGVDYSLTGAGSENGGTISFPLPGSAYAVLGVSQFLTCYLKPPIAQSTNLSNSGSIDLEVHEAAFDLLTMICQSLQEQMDRAVLYPVSSTDEDILNSEDFLGTTRANKAGAEAAMVGAEAARAGAVAARDAADADVLLTHADAATASAGAAVILANQTAITNIADNLAVIQSAPGNATSAVAAAATAEAKAAEASDSAASAAQSAAEAAAAASGGSVLVSPNDTALGLLSVKLLAGNGLAGGIENPGGDEALRLSVALATDPGLEFSAGLLRVKAGTGLVRSASGLAADVGATAGKLVQLDEAGHLPALDARNLTNLPSATDLAAMNAFVAFLGAGRATGPVPKGGIWLFTADELTKTNAYWNPGTKAYENKSPTSVGNSMTGGSFVGSAIVATNLDLNFTLPAGMVVAARIFSAQASSGQKLQFWRPVSGLTYSFVGESQAVTVSAGYNEIPLNTPIQVQAGDRVAVYSPSQQAFVQTTGSGTGAFINGYATTTTTFINGGGVFSVGAVVMSGTTNMAVESPAGVALATPPTKAALYLLHKAVDSLTLNTDLLVKASRGSGWAYASDLAEVCQFDGTYKLLKASIDLSALASGSTGLWGLDTHNLKAQQVRAALALFQ